MIVKDRAGAELQAGDKVLCFSKGSWVDQKEATVLQLEAERSGDRGVLLQFPEGISIVEPFLLKKA